MDLPTLTPVDGRPMVAVDDALKIDSSEWIDHAKALTVTTESDYVYAVTHCAGAKALIKRFKDLFQPHIDRLTEAQNALRADLHTFIDPLVEFERKAKETCTAWMQQEERRKAAEEQERRRQATISQETQRVATAAALETEAKRTGNNQLLQQANRLIDTPAPAPAIMPVQTRVPRMGGVSHSRKWKGRLKSKIDLIRFVAQHPEYEHLLDENQGNIDRTCATFKDRTKIDGIEAYEDFGMSISSGRVLAR